MLKTMNGYSSVIMNRQNNGLGIISHNTFSEFFCNCYPV